MRLRHPSRSIRSLSSNLLLFKGGLFLLTSSFDYTRMVGAVAFRCSRAAPAAAALSARTNVGSLFYRNKSLQGRASGTLRLFGSKRGLPNSPSGEIHIEDNQRTLDNLDLDRLRDTVSRIRTAIGYDTYDVALLLVEDDEMTETNLETRGVDAPTDVLSFPFHAAIRPGELVEPDFDIPDYYNLGDMMIDVPYVIRRCQEDFEECSNAANGAGWDHDDDDEDDVDDRGVSGAMAKVFDAEDRINMLLIHGMLHLVGHDHEDDDEYEIMVSEEERLLRELNLEPAGRRQ